MGVRISWLMLARKLPLATLACSAACRAASSCSPLAASSSPAAPCRRGRPPGRPCSAGRPSASARLRSEMSANVTATPSPRRTTATWNQSASPSWAWWCSTVERPAGRDHVRRTGRTCPFWTLSGTRSAAVARAGRRPGGCSSRSAAGLTSWNSKSTIAPAVRRGRPGRRQHAVWQPSRTRASSSCDRRQLGVGPLAVGHVLDEAEVPLEGRRLAADGDQRQVLVEHGPRPVRGRGPRPRPCRCRPSRPYAARAAGRSSGWTAASPPRPTISAAGRPIRAGVGGVHADEPPVGAEPGDALDGVAHRLAEQPDARRRPPAARSRRGRSPCRSAGRPAA